MLPDGLPQDALLVVLGGSHAYGTSTPQSDTDYRGIIPASPEMLVGLGSWETQFEMKEPDAVLYTLPKFIRLALAANPNIFDVLFAPQDAVLRTTPLGGELRAMAPLFLSRRVLHTYVGYAHSQLQRLRVQNTGSRHGIHQELMDRYHYDTKNALHLVRLYRMGLEILTTGVVQVRRRDAAELLAIRNGAWTLAQVEAYAEEMDQSCRAAAANSPLPEEPRESEVLEWLMKRQTAMLAARIW